MKIKFLVLSLLLSVAAYSQISYDEYFTDKCLRIDFVLSGNSQTQSAALMQLREEPVWGGPRKNLIDPFNYGGYMLKAFDKTGGNMIYSRGFNTLFEEWRTTEQAKKGTEAWTNTAVMPYPRDTAVVVLLARNRQTNLMNDTLLRVEVIPSSIFIDRGNLYNNPVTKLQEKGKPAEKVDLVFVAEGYKAEEQDKFIADANRFMESIFSVPPFDSCREEFNVWAVSVESEDSGTDFSGKGIFHNTALNSGFYTFGTDRYLTTHDIKSVRDAVWNVPCDAIFIIVNSEVYGGGGMYNFYAIGTSDNNLTAEVFVHEFGHSFAGLADEYFSSETGYDDFYNLTLEPWEPNITTLVQFDRKWKNMIPSGTPIPTQANGAYGVGVYEGAGYMSKGIYRPVDHCMMRDLKPFCPVCSKAIMQMVDYLTDKPLTR